MKTKDLIRNEDGSLTINEETIMSKLFNSEKGSFFPIQVSDLLNKFPFEEQLVNNVVYVINQLINKSYIYSIDQKIITADSFVECDNIITKRDQYLVRMTERDLIVYKNVTNDILHMELSLTFDKFLSTNLFNENSYYTSIRKNKKNKYEYLLKYRLNSNDKITIKPDLELLNKILPIENRKFYYRGYLLKLKLKVM